MFLKIHLLKIIINSSANVSVSLGDESQSAVENIGTRYILQEILLLSIVSGGGVNLF